jgi:hypothetical protein
VFLRCWVQALYICWKVQHFTSRYLPSNFLGMMRLFKFAGFQRICKTLRHRPSVKFLGGSVFFRIYCTVCWIFLVKFNAATSPESSLRAFDLGVSLLFIVLVTILALHFSRSTRDWLRCFSVVLHVCSQENAALTPPKSLPWEGLASKPSYSFEIHFMFCPCFTANFKTQIPRGTCLGWPIFLHVVV